MLTNMLLFSFIMSVLSMSMMTQPLPMALALIIISMTVGIFTWLMFSKWVGLSLALIYLGGMMVIFLYISFLTINFKFFFPLHKYSLMATIILFLASTHQSNTIFPKEKLISGFYMIFSSETLIFLICYLLLCLLVVVKLTQCFKGALIKKF